MIAAKNRGRPPLFGKAMTPAQRKKRHLAKRNAELRANPPEIDPWLARYAISAEEMSERLGLPTISQEEIAALQAAGYDPFNPDPAACFIVPRGPVPFPVPISEGITGPSYGCQQMFGDGRYSLTCVSRTIALLAHQ